MSECSPSVNAIELMYRAVISLRLCPASLPLAKLWKKSTTLGVNSKLTRHTLFFTMPLEHKSRITTVCAVAGMISMRLTKRLCREMVVEIAKQPVSFANILAAPSSTLSGSGSQ